LANDNLTDRAFWLNYWKGFVAEPVGQKNWLSDLLTDFPGPGSTLLEIGGFPGSNAAYFTKFQGYDVTILDFLALDAPIRSVERVNGLAEGAIKSIEADLFSFRPTQQFDVVLSRGFIEHFADTRAVLERHVDCLKDGGRLCVSLPNLRSLSGWFLKHFDRKTYDAHNILSMNIPFLREICERLGLTSVAVFYYGTPWVWIDHPEQIHLVVRILVALTNRVITRLPWKRRWLSPHIVILARK
jgi:SAM-dependent methyltransferase